MQIFKGGQSKELDYSLREQITLPCFLYPISILSVQSRTESMVKKIRSSSESSGGNKLNYGYKVTTERQVQAIGWYRSPCISHWSHYPSFLSEPLRLRLNHLFRDDFSLPSEPPSSDGLSPLASSTEALLVLPLAKLLLLPELLSVLTTVKAEWVLSRCFSSSSTYLQSNKNIRTKQLQGSFQYSARDGLTKPL